MFWIGLGVGFILGGNLGVIIIACLKMSKN